MTSTRTPAPLRFYTEEELTALPLTERLFLLSDGERDDVPLHFQEKHDPAVVRFLAEEPDFQVIKPLNQITEYLALRPLPPRR